MNNIDIALNWLSIGIPVIPCKPGTKQPIIAWKQYQHDGAMPSEAEVKKWFNKQYNIAVVTGGKNNLTVLDFDSIPLYYKWKFKNPELSTTYTVTTPRPGKHLYFYLEEPCNTKIGVQAGVDVKSARGIVLVPNSVINGKLYRVVSNNQILTVDRYTSLLRGLNIEEPKVVKRVKPLYEITDVECSSDIDLIRRNVSILELAQSYTDLQPTDNEGRWWMGLCPVHDDKLPSFRIDTLYNKCGCFSQRCSLYRGGDVIDLYAAINRLATIDAVTKLLETIKQ